MISTELTCAERTLRKRAIRDQIALCGMQATYWSVVTMQSSFLISFLKQNGYSTDLTALIVFLNAIANLIAQPLWGYLSDARLGIKRVILCCLGLSIPALALMPAAVSSITFTVVLNLLYSAFSQPLQGLTDAVTNLSSLRNKYVTYGITRGIGSLTAAVTSLFIGSLLNITGIESLFYINAGMLLLAFLMMLLFSGASYGIAGGTEIPRRQESISIRYAANTLIRYWPYVLLVLSNTLINVSNRLAHLFVPILIDEMNGSNGDLGMALFLNCILMAPCMVVHGMMMRRGIKNHWPYIAAGVFMCLRVIAMALCHSLRAVVAVQILQSFGYGLLQPAMVRAVSDVSPLKLRATAISLATAFQIVFSTLLGNNLGSACADVFGRDVTFVGGALLSFLGILLYLPVMKAEASGTHATKKEEKLC